MSTELQQSRQILAFCPSMNNRQVQFETFATTYGELKRDMERAGLTNLDKMKVIEGRTQLEFATDQSVLPSNIRTKTGVTNNLVLVLTPAKINNGALDEMSRSDIYAALKAYRSQSKEANREVKQFFGNYTQTPNNVLQETYFRFVTRTPGFVSDLKADSHVGPVVERAEENKNELFKQQIEASLTDFFTANQKATQSIMTILSEVVDQFNNSVIKFTSDMEELGINIAVTSKDNELENNNISSEFDDFSMEDALEIANAASHVKRY